MDAVKAFNAELLSLMDMKPPISRAKMMSITKAGIKAIKLYKHVVQIIEKFIKRCSPELKVPGLYVVDSIIRQSRHQFGEDKDVFGPRFLKNITMTFQSLYQCPPDDKAKILRVLDLWQKNSMFGMDVIQPLLDMASASLTPLLENGCGREGSPATVVPAQPTYSTETAAPAAAAQTQNPAALAAIAQFLQSTQGLDLQQVLQTLQQSATQATAQPPIQSATATPQKSTIAKVLLDRFDYDEEPEVVEEPQKEETPSSINLPDLQQALQAHLLGQLSNQVLPNVHSALHGLVGSQPRSATPAAQDVSLAPAVPEPLSVSMESEQHRMDVGDVRYSGQSRSPTRRSSSRSRRSRSGSRSRRTWSHRSRSRSREQWRGSPRSRVEEPRDRGRKHKGLPLIKRETLSVCSTTLWIGQLDKKTQQQDISCLMEEFGQIESVNMIPPRGCAYVVMVHRQDAYTALNRLSRGSARINHKPFKIAWAMNKGMNARFKKYWDVELGVTYIPWNRLKAAEIPALCEGGTLDQESLKPEWASVLTDLIKPSGSGGGPEGEQADGAAHPMAGPQLPPLGMDVLGGIPGRPSLSPSLPLSGFNPAHISPEADHIDLPSVDAVEGPKSHTGSPVSPLISGPCAGPLIGPRPGPLPPQRPPFMPPFPNNMPPPNMPPLNMPRLNMPPVNMPQGPVFREGPPGRFRMPMPGPFREDFHSSWEGFPPHGPPRGPMDEDPWEGGPFRDDWQDYGPNRGPEWFGEEPPFRRGGWGRGGPRGRGRFGN